MRGGVFIAKCWSCMSYLGSKMVEISKSSMCPTRSPCMNLFLFSISSCLLACSGTDINSFPCDMIDSVKFNEVREDDVGMPYVYYYVCRLLDVTVVLHYHRYGRIQRLQE